ncbi:DUF3300 domain-containing protein [Rhizobium favelukesii]|uniref:DUF3300 domain-containing protein n=1 Tax=Rhizobium favelukesii TaxID=348824 RepID=W6RQ14_9HYPH|nr:DUF3300 domain-containing protein [Rhizobium favelukesii]MCS0461037.1 DUF3300 domain-containing protein [Rhizobium favelukesii]CDM60938.1 putative protein yacH [Rhizobium favelukesii]
MRRSFRLLVGLSALAIISIRPDMPVHAQVPTPTAKPSAEEPAETEGDLLDEEELEVLVARIALYPDDLVAAISAASLFPLPIVEAARFLEAKKKDADLKPKDDWDGSVISLLNYPDIVKMMSEDLDWTQSLADALTNQQKDVLIAIQQLRDEAVAKNIIKTDDKVTVVMENENVVIRPTDPEKVYIPQYPPEMLYEPGYAVEPISYYPDPYDNYYYPGAGFFAAAVTGVAWAAVVNWDDWGVWGGDWRGDVDIDCNNCFNDRNFNGKVNWNDVDWTKVDRSKLSIGKDQLANIDRSAIKSSLQSDNRNQLKNKVSDRQANRGPGARDVGARANDIRKGTVEGLKANPRAGNAAANRPGTPRLDARPGNVANRPDARPGNAANRPGNVANRSSRPAGKVNRPSAPKMAARPDNRSRQPSALGNVQSGRREAVASKRGGQSMGGGQRGAPRAAAQRSRPMPHGGGGGRGGGRGGGGRGGGGRR